MARLCKPSPGVESHFIGDEILLYHTRTHRLVRLNTAAAYVWCCCEEGLEDSETTARYAATFDTDPDRARQDIAAIITQWRAAGLVDDDEPLPASPDKHAPLELALCDPPPETFKAAASRWYRLLDAVVCIHFDDTVLAQKARSPFRHLETDTSIANPTTTLHVGRYPDGITVFTAEGAVARGLAEDALVPELHAALLVAGYNSADSLVTVHGAAIGNGKHCILLPGDSGSGKSTLAVALAARGWIYHTDEVSVIQADGRLKPFPLAAGLKPGSWDALAPLCPEILDLPIHRRCDGRLIRYLPPPTRLPSEHTAPSVPVSHLVFPRYEAETETSLTPISPSEGLCQLTLSGYDMAGGLDSQRVAALVEWIADRPCFRLVFNELDHALALMEEFLRPDP